MGWTFHHGKSKSDIIRHLTEGPHLITRAKCVRGNVLWAVQESTAEPGRRWIGCYLLSADKGDWGYKDMDESMGPSDINCPLAYLDMVPDPGSYATAWRERVRAKALQDQALRCMKVGDVIVLKEGCRPSRLVVRSIKPLRATAADGYGSFRVPRRMIASVENSTFSAFDAARRLGADRVTLEGILGARSKETP